MDGDNLTQQQGTDQNASPALTQQQTGQPVVQPSQQAASQTQALNQQQANVFQNQATQTASPMITRGTDINSPVQAQSSNLADQVQQQQPQPQEQLQQKAQVQAQTQNIQNTTISGDRNTTGDNKTVSQVSQEKDKVADPKLQFKSGITEEDYKGKTISEILKEKGKIQPAQYEQIKYEIANKSGKEEETLRSKGWVSEDDITRAKAASYGIPFINLSDVDIPRKILTKLPFNIAQAHKAIAFDEDSSSVSVGMVDPLDIQRVGFIRNVVGKDVKTFFASPDDVEMILDTKYAGRMEAQVTEAVEEVDDGIVEIEEGIKDIKEIEETIASAPVARIVNMMLEYAVKFKASDIHIEPRDKRLAVRFRINGIMMERLQLPSSLIPSIVSRIKILSDLKIDEHRVPQDGRFQIRANNKEVDIRVSVMPTVLGEKVVMRLLEKGGDLMRLEDTGIRGATYKSYREALDITQGIILVTGPTGSGKTQTLASSLLILNQPDVNIITLEDPVEIKVDGVNQIQINRDVGLTFAKGLRSVLRQDPDIIMVGEIRDEETAELAVQSSLTGHLVLATLHTNSAAGALPRLLDMHVEPYLITSTVNIIIAQRLVRTLCANCKEAYNPDQDVVKMIHKVMNGLQGFDMFKYSQNGKSMGKPGSVSTTDTTQIPQAELEKQQKVSKNNQITLYKAKGCTRCNSTGYTGRVGIFEGIKVSDKISQMIMEHKSAGAIEKQGVEEGMITMVQDGFMKALEGVTTLEEVLRVQQK